MSEREKELVYNYIKYLGLGTWENVINNSNFNIEKYRGKKE